MDYNFLFHLMEEKERPAPVTLAPSYPLARELIHEDAAFIGGHDNG